MTGDEIREAPGRTKEELAPLLGLGSRTQVTKLERGTSGPSPNAIRLLRAAVEHLSLSSF